MGCPIDTDRNLLFGVLALQADLIDSRQFIDACTLWTTRKHVPLADVLLQNGWLLPTDKSHVDYLVERKMQRHGGDAKASLASAPDQVKRSLAALGTPIFSGHWAICRGLTLRPYQRQSATSLRNDVVTGWSSCMPPAV